MSGPILLILGAGPNIGAHVAKAFASKGYRVALASRKPLNIDVDSSLHVPVDLAKPETVANAFETVRSKLGANPSVVVYNAAAFSADEATDPLSNFNFESYQNLLNVNVTSVIQALQQSVLGFRSLNDPSASKTFIFTGNALNLKIIPGLLTFGLSKGATAFAIQHLVETKVYDKDGITFYYADERTTTGAPAGQGVDGPAAAENYLKLAERKDQGPWLYTFVKGEGYKDFAAGQ